jgi:hypothetical protein
MAIPQRSTGVLMTAAIWNEVVDAINLLDASTSTLTTTGTQTALAIPAGLGDLAIFLNNASLLTVQGISAGLDGQRLTLHSIGAGQVDLAHQNGSASAANRLVNFATSGSTSLAAGSGKAEYQYDLTAARWRLLAHEQGAWITRTFAGGNFTGSGTMTWTVDSGDLLRDAYYLRGRTLSYAWYVQTSTVAGTPSTNLQITIPSGLTAVGVTVAPAWINDNGTKAIGVAFAGSPLTTVIGLTHADDGATWAGATNTTHVRGSIAFEVV